MKKGIIKTVVLAVIFVVAVIALEFVFNTSGEDLTVSMPQASLPVVYVKEEGIRMNPLFGYTQEMNAECTRDTITPIPKDLSLPISIKNYGENVDHISYQVRTLDSSRLIEDTVVEEFTRKKQSFEATLHLQNLLDEGAEYQLIIKLASDNRDIYYYTRIMMAEGMYATECVNFALDFHEKTFDKANEKKLSVYMEPESGCNNNDLHKVDIHSSMNQLFWADFKGTPVEKPVVSVKEIKKEYSVITLSYVLGAKGAHGEAEYYNVEEFYRVRYGADRLYLLEFERTMGEIFQEDGDNFTDKSLRLGIRSEDVNYVSNETGTIVGFVQQGDLWQYNSMNNSLSKVFSFRDYESWDVRENNNQHSIRVVRVDETGSMDFIVYGYMNRGINEGKVGVSVLHFDSIGNSIEEMVWIPATKSYQMMDQIVGKVMYVNDNNQFFIKLDEKILKIDLMNHSESILEEGEGEEWFVTSQDGSCLAWIEGGDANAGSCIHFYNMATGNEQIINAGTDQYLRPLGFIGKDLIYGVAKQSRVTKNISGITIFPMHIVRIVDNKGEIKKEYKKKKIFITSIEMEDYTIRLNRAKYINKSYVAISQDSIMNLAGNSDEVTSVSTVQDGDRQKIVQINLAQTIKKKEPNLITAKVVNYTDNRTMELEPQGELGYYYAYAKGRVVCISPSAAEVVAVASQNMGVVVDEKAQYIWEQAKGVYKDTLSGMKADSSKVGSNHVERALSVILNREGVTVSVGELLASGRSAKEIMQETMKNATVLDLTGCTVDEMFYYVNQGYPVYAMVSNKKPVLICGYTRDRVAIYDPALNGCKGISLSEARETFAKAGNIFLAYVKKSEH